MPNGSLLTRQSPFDGRLYHAASRIWHNNRRAVIIPRLWPRRYAGAARFRPDGRLYHAASRTWYNNRFAVIIPILWPGRYAGAARFRPDGRLYHAASRTWYNNRFAVIIPPFHERFQFFLSFGPPGRENRLCKKHMYDNYFLQKNKNFFTNRRKMI